MTKNKILPALLVIFSSLFLSACGKKDSSQQITPTPTPRLIQLSADQKPYISLIPRADGHLLTLKIDRIPEDFVEIEYEVLYLATDQGIEIEKGLGDTIKVDSPSIERELLLGTESCTHGCKYKYDEGITGGTVTLTLVSKDSQVTTYESKFTLLSGAQIKQQSKLDLPSENFEISALPTNKAEYFVLLKNYGIPKGSSVDSVFSVFSSGTGQGSVKSITPDSITKEDTSKISGDYLVN